MTEKTSSKRGNVITGGTSSPAAEEVIVSNEDLLTQILLRLPAKSLIRFKCVSKNWLLLISDSHFAFNHARRNRNCSISALYFYSPLLSTAEQVNSVSLHGHSSLPTLAFLNGGGGESATIRIKSSCNGLLLCGIDRSVCNRYTTSFIVCNPTTQKFKVLPEHGENSCGAYLAFDPSKSPHYKVVSLRYYRKIDIYSSESVSWKQIDVDALPYHRRREGVFWNGAIHWLIDDVDIHFRFEVDAEKLMRTPHPPRPKILSLDKIRYFGECGGHLILIQMRSRYAMGFRILEMDGDYCCWTVKFWVNLRPLISLFPEIDQRTRDCKFHVLCVVKGENENDFALGLAIAGKAISYNLKFKTFKVLHDHLPQDYFEKLNGRPYPFALTYQFVESLSLV